jgi:ketosteroid isomerase-like protein
MNGVLELLEPNVEWHPAKEDPDAGPHYARDGVKKFFQQWLDSFGTMHLEAEGFLEQGDKVLVLLRYRAVGRSSGAPVEDRVYQVYTLREDRAVRVDEFYDRVEAFEAAGMEADPSAATI